MDGFSIKPLDASTWEAFSRLAEKNGGVWGGCWCMGFHGEGFGPDRSAERNRRNKEGRVRAGTAHAALVFEDGAAIGWCQYGAPEELPRIKLKKEVAAASPALPDWRITCFFVDKEHRGRGVSGAALAGALALIAAAGGGVVESYPEDVSGRRTSASFLYNSSLRIFEEHGFERVARLGKNHWLVRKSVGAAGGACFVKRVYEDISRRLQELGGPAISPEGAIGEAVAIVVSHGWLGRWDEFIDVKVLVDGSLALDCSYRIDSESAADKIWGMDELAGHAAQNIYRLLRSRRSGQ